MSGDVWLAVLEYWESSLSSNTPTPPPTHTVPDCLASSCTVRGCCSHCNHVESYLYFSCYHYFDYCFNHAFAITVRRCCSHLSINVDSYFSYHHYAIYHLNHYCYSVELLQSLAINVDSYFSCHYYSVYYLNYYCYSVELLQSLGLPAPAAFVAPQHQSIANWRWRRNALHASWEAREVVLIVDLVVAVVAVAMIVVIVVVVVVVVVVVLCTACLVGGL